MPYLGFIEIFHQIENYNAFTADAKEALAKSFEEKVLAKGEYLVTEGKICRHLYFLQKGAIRGYYNIEGKEVTHWFAFEKDFFTSFHSFITQQSSVENIQLLEGCILWAISKEKVDQLMDQYHEIEKAVRRAYENYYIRLEERFVNAQFKTATERYLDLLKHSPHIIERVPLGHIASYLGISSETLSRIRSQL